MPTAQVLTPPESTAEPVSLALAVAHTRADLDLTSTDPAIMAQVELLQLYVSAARERVEAYTGRYFAAQTLQITYALTDAYVLPAGGEAVSVTGYFTDLDQLASLGQYLEEYRKGITVSRDLPLCEAFAQTYTVTATVTGDPQYANLAKRAILEIAAEWYKNRETSGGSLGTNLELPVSWRVTLAPAVINPLGC